MTSDANQKANTPASPAARTDDLLASGAEAQDGARGFADGAQPDSLQTGMEGIAEATIQQGKVNTDSRQSDPSETVQDNPGQVRNRQG